MEPALLVTTPTGIYHVGDDDAPRRVLDGHHYGLTRKGADWFAYQKLGKDDVGGRLVTFRISADGEAVGRRTICPDVSLDHGCHQLDFGGPRGDLFLADTYRNRIARFAVPDEGVPHYVSGTYPRGPLDPRLRRQSSNYAHFNSLWWDGAAGEWLVMCHNRTTHTKRRSEVLVLDDMLTVQEAIPNCGGNAHNVLRFDGRLMYCDSNDGSLVHDHRRVAKLGQFTRGLAVCPGADRIFVGGSDFASRARRDKAAGRVFVLDCGYHQIGAIVVPSMVHEVRAVAGDLGMGGGV